jgi:hypothetical protein
MGKSERRSEPGPRGPRGSRDPLVSSDVSREVEVMAKKPSRSGHRTINGLLRYHEVYGEFGTSKSSPLLLIPGAFMGLVILAATSHIGIFGESAVPVPMVSAFVDDVPPTTPDLF